MENTEVFDQIEKLKLDDRLGFSPEVAAYHSFIMQERFHSLQNKIEFYKNKIKEFEIIVLRYTIIGFNYDINAKPKLFLVRGGDNFLAINIQNFKCVEGWLKKGQLPINQEQNFVKLKSDLKDLLTEFKIHFKSYKRSGIPADKYTGIEEAFSGLRRDLETRLAE